MTASRAARVAVVGDGPAGCALTAALATTGVDVALHGTGEPWTATYATWRDDVAWMPDAVFTATVGAVEVIGATRRRVERAYSVFDADALRAHLLARVPGGVTVGRVPRDPSGDLAADALDADLVVDASGAAPVGTGVPWQTAYGVVLPEAPAGVAPGTVTLMDWRPAGGDPDDGNPDDRDPDDGPPSFCYVVPVHDGWMVEETVLAAAPAVAPAVLRGRLERRLGADGQAAVARARRVEEVWIPMRLPAEAGPGGRDGRVVRFGAAAGFVHPATGYSVAASLRAAPRVAAAIAAGRDPAGVARAVWPPSHRRARVLHEYGLDALLRLGRADVATFFDAFFALPTERWAPYLRVDVGAGAVAGVMAGVFRRAPWRVRRRLAVPDPRVPWRLAAASAPSAARPAPSRRPPPWRR